MTEKLEITISADSENFKQSLDAAASQAQKTGDKISDVGEKSKGAGDKLDAMADNAGKAEKKLDDVSSKGKKAADSLDTVKKSAGNTANALGGIGDAVASAGNLSQLLGNLGGQFASLMAESPVHTAIFVKAIESVIQICGALYTQSRESLKNTADNFKNTAEELKCVNEEQQKSITSSNHAAEQLGQLANYEKLSNTQKLQQIQLLKELSRGYGELFGTLENGNAVFNNFDEAMAEKLKRDQERQLMAIDAEMASIKAAKKAQADIIDSTSRTSLVLTNGKSADDAKTAAQEITNLTKRYMELMKARNELANNSNPAEDYRKRAEARKQDEKNARHDTAAGRLAEMKQQQARGEMSEYDRRRAELNDNIKAISDELTPSEQQELENYRLQELEKINAEEKAAHQKLIDDKAAMDRRAEEDRIKMEEATARERARLEEAAAREREATQQKALANMDKLEQMAAAREQQRIDALDAQKIGNLQRMNGMLDAEMAKFGFNLDEDYTNESNADRRKRRQNMKLDAGIADKLAAQARGQKVHFSTREQTRLDELRQLQEMKKQNNAQIEQIKAAAAQAKAADAALKATQEQEKVTRELDEAAKKLDSAAEKLAPAAAVPESGSATVTTPGGRLAMRRAVAEVPGIAPAALSTSGAAAASGADCTVTLGQILSAVQDLKSNTYIVR